MRTFGLTIYATVTAGTEQDALALAERLLPEGLGSSITIDGSELTAQHCVDCWCEVQEDDIRCADCRQARRSEPASGCAMPSPGRLRFCGWLCHDGYREDRRHGLLTLPRSFAEAGCCMYCGADVPTNAERRAAASAAATATAATDSEEIA